MQVRAQLLKEMHLCQRSLVLHQSVCRLNCNGLVAMAQPATDEVRMRF